MTVKNLMDDEENTLLLAIKVSDIKLLQLLLYKIKPALVLRYQYKTIIFPEFTNF